MYLFKLIMDRLKSFKQLDDFFISKANNVLVNEVKDTKKTDNAKTNTVTNATATPTTVPKQATTTPTTNANENTNTTVNNVSDKNYLYIGTTNNFKTYEVSIDKDIEINSIKINSTEPYKGS